MGAIMERMSRAEVVQTLLNLFDYPDYLEIGVNKGETFSQIQAESKTGVDPGFHFDVSEWSARMPNAEFHEVTSDAFFSVCERQFDVIYLDGLHTFEQTLRDFCNSISVLKPGGIILIDDTIPNSYHAAMPDLRKSLQVRKARNDKSGSWMGDVYRLVYFIDAFFQRWSVGTLVENHGQTIVWEQKRAPEQIPPTGVSKIANLPYEDVFLNKAPYRRMELDQIVREIKAAKGLSSFA